MPLRNQFPVKLMIPHRVPYAATHRFAPIVLDHLAGAPSVVEHRTWPPDRAGVHAAAEVRSFDAGSRAVLCAAIERQYEGIAMGGAVREGLLRLASPDTLTVTTGHQLCLFTGPLYLPFKLLNTVRLARTLSNDLGRPVVPVFWMATEDHDRAEIDHAWLSGTRVHWPGKASGAVGRLPLTGIEAAVEQAVSLLGPGAHAPALAELLRDCYRPDRTLAQATRAFIHALFGRFGILCLDGDDAALKQLFQPVMRDELLNQVGQRTVAYANARLGPQHSVQAHARGINLFHLAPGHRRRIELDGSIYRVLDGGPRWDLDQLLATLEQHPEEFSPNVLLRPVFQETILPNIAYIGGGGELAYWLQLRWLFQAMGVPMPAVLLRTSAGFLSHKALMRWNAMGLSVEDLFSPLDAVKARVAIRDAGFDTSVEEERAVLTKFYHDLAERAAAADPTLRGAVEARAKAGLKGLDRIGRGLVRAAKRREQVSLQRMEAVHAEFFPGGGLQERRDNILPLLAARGEGLLDELLELLDPLDARFTLIEQD